MTSPPKLAIVADDLTGLQAIASEFSRFGLGVRTVLHPEALTLDGNPDVLGVDTHSRHLPAGQAANAVRAAVGKLHELGIRHVYKQADSGMQGPLAVEIEAAMTALGAPGAVHAPSCPVLGRVMQGARQRDHAGLDVDVAALWAAQTGRTPARCEATSWVSARQGHTSAVWLADAQTDAQLHALAAAAWPLGEPEDGSSPWLLAGSVGLASAVASVWRRRVPRPAARPVLVVAGSLQSQTRRQTETLATVADAQLLVITDQPMSDAQRAACVAQAADCARHGRHLVVSALPGSHATTTGDGGYPLVSESARRSLAENLTQLMRTLLSADGHWPWAGLLVAGGATADMVARDALQVTRTDVQTWLAPGVAGAVAFAADRRQIPLVTKAGTWGDTDVLMRGIEWIVTQDLILRAGHATP